MKIDTSNINLSSAWAFSEENQMKFERGITFNDVLDQRVCHHDAILTNSHPHVRRVGTVFQHPCPTGLHPPHLSFLPSGPPKEVGIYKLTTFKGQEAVELSLQFQCELEKMRRIIDEITNLLNSTGSSSCSIQLKNFDRVHINPQRARAKMMGYESFEKRTLVHHEKEAIDFFADGIVNTMDGRSIDFSFQMDLDREFFRQDQFKQVEKGYTMVDPLVINLGTTTPQLSGVSVSFDLDMDGEDEDIPLLKSGSGFLSLDKNKDGIINDGSELFGPSTGDGFGELRRYDLDNNFWIDENDAIFDELLLWGSDDSGEMQLTKVKDAGIGAIYLVGVQTPFDLKDEENQLQARIKESGVALNEDGSVSSIQEIDWTA